MIKRRRYNLSRMRREIFEDEAMQRERDEAGIEDRELSHEDIQRMVQARRKRTAPKQES